MFKIILVVLSLLTCSVSLANCEIVDSVIHVMEVKDALLKAKGGGNFLKRAIATITKEEKRLLDMVNNIDNASPKMRKAARKAAIEGRRVADALADVAKTKGVKYVNPGHHDLSQPLKYIKGKSHLPPNHAELFENAIPLRRQMPNGTNKISFWACTAGGVFHRFQGNIEGGLLTFHWNGATEGFRSLKKRDIPAPVRSYWKGRNSKCK